MVSNTLDSDAETWESAVFSLKSLLSYRLYSLPHDILLLTGQQKVLLQPSKYSSRWRIVGGADQVIKATLSSSLATLVEKKKILQI